MSLRRPPVVLLDDCRPAHEAGRTLLFTDPLRTITATSIDDVTAALAEIDAAGRNGYHVAGWMAYEAAAAFEPRLASIAGAPDGWPLLWFGVFEHVTELDRPATDRLIEDALSGNARMAEISDLEMSVDEATYGDNIDRIHAYLTAGDVYQINYTFDATFHLEGDTIALYDRLRRSQPVAFGAYIDMGDRQLLSLSPELFLDKARDKLTVRPMKGTAARGRDINQDRAIASDLRADEKSRAENLMIVDLLRNDLSRLAESGSVDVENLFQVETYLTILQMTSTVHARVAADTRPSDLIAALFPCGSVTGAPKIRAMEIIHELEGRPRGAYTGAIGYIAPTGNLTFNVPIRTLRMVPEQGGTGARGTLAIGSGIVADSEAEKEYQECLLKSRFLTHMPQTFALIETLRWQDGGFALFDHHRARLEASAAYFNFPHDAALVDDHLALAVADLDPRQGWRVRLLLDAAGKVSVTVVPLAPLPDASEIAPIKLWPDPVDRDDIYLYHKTTNRRLFDAAAAAARDAGLADMIFANERGELTEGAVSSLFLSMEGTLFTPPVQCGLLAGTLRADLLADKTQRVEEKILAEGDLDAADRIFIGNSVRGLREVTYGGRF